MEAISLPKDQDLSSVKWKQLWSLVALYSSVVIGWIAYYRYQPRLLEQYNFTNFSFLLVAAQAVILLITPPVAGWIGDRYRLTKGHRIPIISAGMSFAAMIFMAVAFTLIGEPGEVFRWILPVLIILWLIGMSIFTSPALSSIELFVPVDKLPYAMAVITIAGNMVYALEPVIVDIIDYIGAPATFIAGGLAVFISGLALKKTSMSLFSRSEDEVVTRTISRTSRYSFTILLGVGLGFATTMLFNVFPHQLELKAGAFLGGLDGNMIVVLMLVFSALISWPVSNLVYKAGLDLSFKAGILLTLVGTAGIFMISIPAIILFFMGLFSIAFTLLSVSSLPLVIRESSYKQKVFCVGLFFAGVAIPDGIVEVLMAL